MPFTQQNLIYTTEYSKAMANAYPYWSYFADLYGSPNSATYKPLGGNAVLVQSMSVSGAKFTDRNNMNGQFTRNFNTQGQVLTMSMDRDWDTLVDPMDMQEDAIVTIANITQTFNQFQKVPEMDVYAASTLAGAASGFGSVDATALTTENILATWDSYLAYMVNQRVPRDRIRCKMTPDTYKLLKEAAGITRFVESDTGIRNIDRNVGKLDGVVIMEVPSDMMMTAYDFTQGWQVAAGAQQINMLMFDPMAIAAPVVYDVSMMSAPTAQSKGKWLYYERYYYDVFALNQRLPGIFANIAAKPTILNTIQLTSAAGGSGQTVVTMEDSVPYGMTAYYKVGATAETVTYGMDVSGWTPFISGAPIAATAGQYVTVVLANTSGVIGGPAFATNYGSVVAVVGA